MTERVVDAFWPVIELAQAVAYPLSFLAIAVGICLIIVGQRHNGWQTIKWGAIGYLLMQLLPGFMKILHDVGRGMVQ